MEPNQKWIPTNIKALIYSILTIFSHCMSLQCDQMS